jgi:hypothetical protein
MRAHRGQTLVMALAILFILLFLGGVFVAEVARNLAFAGRNRDTNTAIALAQAGLSYCQEQLVNGPLGADWRPQPTMPMTTPADTNGVTDPDYQWLAQGFSRVSATNGRYLVRVTYDPHPDDPASQRIRVEAIGRSGDLGNGLDPTIFVQNGPAPRLRAERSKYMPLGLTEYGLYVTNKDHSPTEAVIGTPPIGRNVATVLGDPIVSYTDNGGNQPYATGVSTDPLQQNPALAQNIEVGFPIYCNTDARFYGDLYFYESPRGNPYTSGVANGTSAAIVPTPAEAVYIAGRIFLGPTRNQPGIPSNADGNYQVSINNNINDSQKDSLGNTVPRITNIVRESSDPLFDTFGGLIRDNSTLSDRNGYTRSVPYLDPPRIDTPVTGSDVSRYAAITRDSGYWLTSTYNTGQGGWGTGVYIDNPGDIQNETQVSGLNGSSSLRSEWLNAVGTPGANHWNGPIYNEPATHIELLGDHIRLIRDDDRVFTDPGGNPLTAEGGKVLDIPLVDQAANPADNPPPNMPRYRLYISPGGQKYFLPPFPHDGDEPGAANAPWGAKGSFGVNVVIYATGNVSVRGTYGGIVGLNGSGVGRVHLTIVTNGTAYIDGNVVKGDGYLDANNVFHPERGSTCAIMARDYVCLNTTTFMRPQSANSAWSSIANLLAYNTEIGETQPTFDLQFSAGVPFSTYLTTTLVGGTPTTVPSPLFAMMRHGAVPPGPSYINMLINPAFGVDTAVNFNNQPITYDSAAYAFDPMGANTSALATQLLFTYPLGLAYSASANLFLQLASGSVPGPNFEGISFPLRGEYINNVFIPDYVNPATALTGGTNTEFFPTLLGVNNTQTGLPIAGYENVLRFQLDQTGAYSGAGLEAGTDYLLGSATVAPMDIRVEALLYAQNRSFFIIPGPYPNPDPSDSRTAFTATGARKSYARDSSGNVLDSANAKLQKDIYPYANEPTDIRITIYGAIAENQTASIGDQTAWFQRWGWIPGTYGSSNIPVPDDHLKVHDPQLLDASNHTIYRYNPGEAPIDTYGSNVADMRTVLEQGSMDIPTTRGLRFQYDPAFALPYAYPTLPTLANATTRSTQVLRYNLVSLPGGGTLYQALPAIPRLPVCPTGLSVADDLRVIGR